MQIFAFGRSKGAWGPINMLDRHDKTIDGQMGEIPRCDVHTIYYRM
jgi:hypothetical protein